MPQFKWPTSKFGRKILQTQKLTKEEVYKIKFTNYSSYSANKISMYNFYRFAKADVRIENTLIGSQIFAYNQNKDS